MVTEMYSLPAYDGVDPNPLMAPFFIVFFGVMLADMGYGTADGAGLLALSGGQYRPEEGDHGDSTFFGLLGLCGVSTFVMGRADRRLLRGLYLTQLAQLIHPESTLALPSPVHAAGRRADGAGGRPGAWASSRSSPAWRVSVVREGDAAGQVLDAVWDGDRLVRGVCLSPESRWQ